MYNTFFKKQYWFVSGCSRWSLNEVWCSLETREIKGWRNHQVCVEGHRICTTVIKCLHWTWDDIMFMFDLTNDGSRLFPNTAVLKFMTPQGSWLRFKTQSVYTGCFTTCEHYCRRWIPRSLWSKKGHINMCPILDGYGVMTAWNLE